jgi:hypothetical protein
MRRRARLLAAATLVVALVAPVPAGAHPYPGEYPADERVRAAVAVAIGFWGERNVTSCPFGISAMVAPSLLDVDGDAAARGGGCRIWVRQDNLAAFRQPGTRRWRVYGATDECALIVHEVGHALGLEHTPDGVMAAGGPQAVPWACREWARRLVPRRRLVCRPRSRSSRPRACAPSRSPNPTTP